MLRHDLLELQCVHVVFAQMDKKNSINACLGIFRHQKKMEDA